MEKKTIIRTSFGAVYLINGKFSEGVEHFFYDYQNALYITVLPLDAQLLPYTVKIAQDRVANNEKLATIFYYNNVKHILLKERHNYIYNITEPKSKRCTSAEKLFNAVKSENLSQARNFMTSELNASIDDNALVDFFKKYTAVASDVFSTAPINSFSQTVFAITSDKEARKINFSLNPKGLVDDIVLED